MITETIRRKKVAITLKGGNGYSDENGDYDITYEQLEKAAIGDHWNSDQCGSDRDSIWQEATMVFRNGEGCALLIKTVKGTDFPNPEIYDELSLVWIEL